MPHIHVFLFYRSIVSWERMYTVGDEVSRTSGAEYCRLTAHMCCVYFFYTSETHGRRELAPQSDDEARTNGLHGVSRFLCIYLFGVSCFDRTVNMRR